MEVKDVTPSCEELILAQGPFDSLTDAARTGLANFLAQSLELEGTTATVAEHAAKNWSEFSKRVALLGAMAASLELDHYRREGERGNAVRPFLALGHDSLVRAWGTVSATSATRICEPG